jgi:hypothetical protein
MRKVNTLDKAGAPLFVAEAAAAQESCGNDSIPRKRGNARVERAADAPAAALGGAVARRGRENVLDLIEPTWSVGIHRAAHYARHDADASAPLVSAFG